MWWKEDLVIGYVIEKIFSYQQTFVLLTFSPLYRMFIFYWKNEFESQSKHNKSSNMLKRIILVIYTIYSFC